MVAVGKVGATAQTVGGNRANQHKEQPGNVRGLLTVAAEYRSRSCLEFVTHLITVMRRFYLISVIRCEVRKVARKGKTYEQKTENIGKSPASPATVASEDKSIPEREKVNLSDLRTRAAVMAGFYLAPVTALTPTPATSTVVPTTGNPILTVLAATDTAASATATTAQPGAQKRE